MTEAASTTPAPETVATSPTNTANPTPAPAANSKQPPWGTPENFNAEKAWELIQNLRNEKADPALKSEIDAIRAEQEEGRKRLAAALGLTEPPKTEDALAETVKSLQEQFAASQLEATRLRFAAQPGVDAEGQPLPAIPPEFHNLLTETDTEKLRAQAETVSKLVAAQVAASATPQFQANPGQGQNGDPASPEALAEAEYRQYHPLPSRK